MAQVNNVSDAIFERISDVSSIVSGDRYLIANPGATGKAYILDGSIAAQRNPIAAIDPIEVDVNGNGILTKPKYSFIFTENDEGLFTIKSSSNQTVFLNPGSEVLNYNTSSESPLHFDKDGNVGFNIYRQADNNGHKYCIHYNEDNNKFSGLQITKKDEKGYIAEYLPKPSVDLFKLEGYLAYSTNECNVIYEDRLSTELPTLDAYNFNYVFSSSEPSVATVVESGDNKGQVTIVGAGTTIITVRGYWRPSITASYMLKVLHRASINWNPETRIEINQDVTSRLNLWTNSNGEVTYTSSDPDILSVSADGKTVTAVGVGTATLTASVPQTATYTAATTDPVTITVAEPVQMNYVRIAELSDIVSGGNYLIVHQKAINENTGSSLDGYQTGGAARSVQITNSIIQQSQRSSFVITSLAGGKYSIKGNGNDKYIDPKDTEITYQNSSASLQIEHEGDGFVIRRVAGVNDSKYIVYEGGSFTGRKNATGSSRKVYIYKEVDLSKQIAHLTFWSEGDWVTAGKTLNTGYWTDNESGRISYISSNPSIATVDANGIVTGVAPGDVDILAVLHEDATHYSVSSCVTITVMDDYTDPQLIFGPQGGVTEIPVKSTLRTETSHRGGGVVVYNSSDPTVADIDANGVIHTYNVGHTVLTARLSADGFYTEASKSFMLTVIKRDPLVTPSFTYKAIALGEKTNLLLTTESTGAHHFSTSDAGIATIDANGVITSKGVGEVQIGYWVDECDNYNASVVQYVTLKVTEAAKKTPIIQITPSEVIVPVGGSMRVLAEMIDFGGQYSAALETDTDIAEMQQLNKGGFEATYNVTGLKPGTTYIVFTCAETQDYYKYETRIPVTVLDIYQYNLVIGGEVPSKGVSVEIAGVTHTSAGTFNTYRSEINVSDVVVRPVAGYMASVSISGRTITVTYALKGVTAGTFIRLRNYNCNLYATLSADGQSLGVAAEGLSNILYLDKNNHLLFYQNGQYVKSTNVMGNVGDAGSTYTFTRGSGEYKECFSIRSNENKYLLASSTGTTTDDTSAGSDFAYWYVEELTELPVNVSTAGYGYATIYCPVALNIAGGADAYYVSRKERKANSTGVEYWLTLSPFKSSIPANTPAVIIGVPGTTYQFGLVEPNNEGDITVAAGMTGHVAASLTSSISGKVFTLQPNSQEEKVGFYPWTNRVTYGFKAYFTSSNNEAAYYRLVFEGEEATDILQLEAIEAQETIYDLCGRSMGDSVESLPRGIYVRAGRKFVVK